MHSYAGPPTPGRSGDVAGTLRLLALLAISFGLMVLDHRGGWLTATRQQASLLVQPLWMVAGWPGRMAGRLYDDAGTMRQLSAENRQLRNELLVHQARMARMRAVADDNIRLRSLLDAAQRGSLDVQLAPILNIDLDPSRQRLVLNAGSRDGVSVGQSVIDAGGLVGQVIAATPMHATVLLLTDPSHAVPVAVARSGVRLVAYGEGLGDELRLPSIPLSSDIRQGDLLVTSGLGARFPAGFPVGTITRLEPDDSRAFLVGSVRPAAQLDRGREVLLLRKAPPAPAIEADVPQSGGVSEPGAAAEPAMESSVSGGAAAPRRPQPVASPPQLAPSSADAAPLSPAPVGTGARR